jgi:hypothetical protein
MIELCCTQGGIRQTSDINTPRTWTRYHMFLAVMGKGECLWRENTKACDFIFTCLLQMGTKLGEKYRRHGVNLPFKNSGRGRLSKLPLSSISKQVECFPFNQIIILVQYIYIYIYRV